MIIYLHSFHHSFASNGIKITYELIRILNELGYSAKNLCFDPYIEGSNFPEEYLKNTIFCTNDSFPKINDDDIMIYPEHVQGNPLSAKRIVRYLLNKPYYLFGYGIDYLDSDYVMAFSQLVNKDLPILYMLLDERELFSSIKSNSNKKADTISIYFGKCDLKLLATKKALLKELRKTYKSIHVITRQYPERIEALNKIAESKMLVSFDPLSNLNYESTLLGTPVFLVDDFYETKNIELPAPQRGIFYSEDGLKQAEKDVLKSYDYYCDYLERQTDIIKAAFENIATHFSKIADCKYLNANKERNLLLKQFDYEQFKNRKKETYTSIDFYDKIPCSIALNIGLLFNRQLLKQRVKSILKFLHLFNFAKKIAKFIRIRGGGICNMSIL